MPSENLPARRRKKRRMPMRLRTGVLITILILVVAAAGALMAPPLKVVDVYCEGNVNLKAEDIITTAHLETGKNILLSNIGRAKRAVGKLPLADEVTVRRVFPNRICISVKERIPAAYVMSGSYLAALDIKGVVLETIGDGRVNTVIQTNIPSLTPHSSEEENAGENKADGISGSDGDRADNKADADKTDENSGNSIDKDSESGENKPEEAADNNTGSAENGGGDASEDAANVQDSGLNIYSVPLVAGVELSNAEAGRNAKCGDEVKLQTVLGICSALDGAGLLNKATYIDVSDTADVRVMIENRLEVQLGAPDNMEYRAKFLSEIISTKISTYEKAVMDYRGNDIYVRQPDDGKLRVEPKKDTSKKSDGNGDEGTNENSDDEEFDDSDGDSGTSDRESDDEPDSQRSGEGVLDGGGDEE